MTAHIDRYYEFKIFEAGQFYQLALELINYIGTDLDQCHFRIGYTVEDIRITDKIAINQLAEIKEVGGNFDSIAFDIDQESIKFFECCGNIRVLFTLSFGIKEAKDIAALTESILHLQRIEETQPVNEMNSDKTYIEQNDLEAVTSGEKVAAWEKALRILRTRMEERAFQTWILPLSGSTADNNLFLLSPNEFATDWLKSRYYSLIESTVKSIDPSIEDIIIRYSDKSIGTMQSER